MKFIGWEDRYFPNTNEGLSVLYIFCIPVWDKPFFHSTWLSE